jgi:phosphomevalonate kinase
LSIRINIPGKLILLGEYAVLEGADALVAAVDRFAIVKINESQNEEICLLKSSLDSKSISFKIDENGKIILNAQGDSDKTENWKFALAAIEFICTKITAAGLSVNPFEMNLDTSQFFLSRHKLGLGSSAALTVAIMISLFRFHNLEPYFIKTRNDLFRLAHQIHQQVQGNRGSGVDIAASISGGICVYNMAQIENKKKIDVINENAMAPGLYMIPVWTGVSASTGKLLASLEGFRQEEPETYDQIMDRLITLSNIGCSEYKKNNLSPFLDILSEYYEVLEILTKKSGIPIISDIHKKLAHLVKPTGGVYKPSGAGEGDLGLVFSNSADVDEKIRKQLINHSIETLSMCVVGSDI